MENRKSETSIKMDPIIIGTNQEIRTRTNALVESLFTGDGQMSIDKLVEEIVILQIYAEKTQGMPWEKLKELLCRG